MTDSTISGLNPLTEPPTGDDLTIFSHLVSPGVYQTVKVSLATIKSYVVFNISVDDIFGLGNVINQKANINHSHVIADVTGLNTALNGKAPSIHTHTLEQINGLSLALNGKSNIVHGHAMSDINGLSTALNGKSNVDHTHDFGSMGDISDLLDGKANVDHSHSMADIINLEITLSSKANITHQHTIASIANLTMVLDGKAPLAHQHTVASITGLTEALGNKLDVNGSIPVSQVDGLAVELAGKSPTTHTHQSENILLTSYVETLDIGNLSNGDNVLTALTKLQNQITTLKTYDNPVVFEPIADFSFAQGEGTLYRFSDLTMVNPHLSSITVSLTPGFYRVVAAAPAPSLTAGVDVVGRWVKVFNTSETSVVYASQETLGLDAAVEGVQTSIGNPAVLSNGGVGYQNREVRRFLFSGSTELNKGESAPAGGMSSGAVAVSRILDIQSSTDLTIMIGSNVANPSTNDNGGYVWIRQLDTNYEPEDFEAITRRELFEYIGVIQTMLVNDGMNYTTASVTVLQGYISQALTLLAAMPKTDPAILLLARADIELGVSELVPLDTSTGFLLAANGSRITDAAGDAINLQE